MEFLGGGYFMTMKDETMQHHVHRIYTGARYKFYKPTFPPTEPPAINTFLARGDRELDWSAFQGRDLLVVSVRIYLRVALWIVFLVAFASFFRSLGIPGSLGGLSRQVPAVR